MTACHSLRCCVDTIQKQEKRKWLSVGIEAHGRVAIGISAHGFVAIGVSTHGIISVGLVSMGVVSIGLVSMGVMSLSVVGMGLVSLGQQTMGLMRSHDMESHQMPAIESMEGEMSPQEMPHSH
ncbi:hypothetical protein CKA32_000749 [Geitlerinema sp. FC II]|nr:hypothetical protein CKA32_000749 [Geitlerinema sp. FC II]